MTELMWLLSRVGVRTQRRFRLFLKGGALVAGLVAGYGAGVCMEERLYWPGFGVFCIVILFALVEFVCGDVFADKAFPYDTERKLDLMERRVGAEAIRTVTERLRQAIDALQGCDKSLVSGTVHMLADISDAGDARVRKGLLQITDYVGPEGGRKGRVTLVNQGIIGRCARTERQECAGFADEDDYRMSMVRDFGFTKEEAGRHTASARSYLAHPLKVEGAVVGVMFFFTTEPQVFPRAGRQVEWDSLAQEVVNYLKLVRLA